jgi:hypothetical protein
MQRGFDAMREAELQRDVRPALRVANGVKTNDAVCSMMQA